MWNCCAVSGRNALASSINAAKLDALWRALTGNATGHPGYNDRMSTLGALHVPGRAAMWAALASALIAAGCGSAAAPTAPSPSTGAPPAIRRVVVLGDSLAVSPSIDQSFPAELQARIARRGLP